MYQAYLILYLGLDIKIKYFCFTTYMRGSVSLEGVNLFVRGISGILRIVLLYLNYMFYNYIGWIFQEEDVSQQVTPCFNILGVFFISYEGQPGLETSSVDAIYRCTICTIYFSSKDWFLQKDV